MLHDILPTSMQVVGQVPYVECPQLPACSANDNDSSGVLLKEENEVG